MNQADIDACKAVGVDIKALLAQASGGDESGFVDPRKLKMVVFSQKQLAQISKEKAKLAATMSADQIRQILRDNPTDALNADTPRTIVQREDGFLDVK